MWPDMRTARAATNRFMTQNTKPPFDSPFARWSRLKREAAREKEKDKDRAAAQMAVPSISAGAQPATSFGTPPSRSPGSAPATSPGAPLPQTPAASRDTAGDTPHIDELPPVESLTFDSDFAPYFQPRVDAALQRQALKQLLRDPHFNVMDGLDVYIDDYSKPDPIPPEIVREMVQGRYIFDPPPTRINAQGHVEDVPPEELAALSEAKDATGGEALAVGEATPAIADTANTAPGLATVPSASPSTADEIQPAVIPFPAPAAKDTSAR